MRMKPQQIVVWRAILSIFCRLHLNTKTSMNNLLNRVLATSILTQRRGIAMTFSGIGQVITVLYAMGPGHHQMEWFLSIMSAVYVVRLLFINASPCISRLFLFLVFVHVKHNKRNNWTMAIQYCCAHVWERSNLIEIIIRFHCSHRMSINGKNVSSVR